MPTMPTRRGAIATAVVVRPPITTAAPTGPNEVRDQLCDVGQLCGGSAPRTATRG
jgi:hypothetical protein